MDVSNLTIKIQTSGLETAQQGLDKLGQKAHKAETSAGQLANSFKSLNTIIAGVASSLVVREFIKTADEMSLLNSRLKMTTSSMGEFTRQQKEMHKIARDTHSSIQDVTNLYVKLAPALKGVGKSTQEINKITSSFTKALQLGGASAEESASAIKQFGQAMGSGVLRGEEFNAIAEASPTLLRYLAEGLNVPIGKLRELGSQGKLTAEALANAFDKMNDKISADFKNMPLTVGKAVTDLRTEITLLTNEINQTAGVTQGISEIIAGVSNIIKENKDGIVSVTSGVITLTKYLSALAVTFYAVKGAKSAYMALQKPFLAQVSAGTIRLSLMDRTLMKVGVSLGAVKGAFMRFLPTAGIFLAAEAIFALKEKFDEAEVSAKNFKDIMALTNKELKELTANTIKDYLVDLKKQEDKLKASIDGVKKSIEDHEMTFEADEVTKQNTFNELTRILQSYKQQLDEVIEKQKEFKNQLDIKTAEDTHGTAENYLKGVKSKMDAIRKEFESIEIEEKIKKRIEDARSKLAHFRNNGFFGGGLSEEDKVTIKQIEKYIRQEQKKLINLSKDYNNALKDMRRAVMSDYEKDIDEIKTQTKTWIEAGASIKEALEIEKRLIDKRDRLEADNILKAFAEEKQKAKDVAIKSINEELKLADRRFNLKKRQAELTKDEISKSMQLIALEYEHTQAQYEALLKKGEITKEYYDQAMRLEKKLYERQIFDASRWGQIMHSGLNSLETAMGSFFDYSSDRFMKFGDLANDILSSIAREMTKMMIIQPFVGVLSEGIGGLFSGGGKVHSRGAMTLQNAQGNVFSSKGLHEYVNSIVSKPTFFEFASGGVPSLGVMGEKNGGSPEAIMPLTRMSNGDLGVKSSGVNNVKIEVINQTREDVQVTNVSSRQNMGEQVISIVIDAVRTNKMGMRDILGGGR